MKRLKYKLTRNLEVFIYVHFFKTFQARILFGLNDFVFGHLC